MSQIPPEGKEGATSRLPQQVKALRSALHHYGTRSGAIKKDAKRAVEKGMVALLEAAGLTHAEAVLALAALGHKYREHTIEDLFAVAHTLFELERGLASPEGTPVEQWRNFDVPHGHKIHWFYELAQEWAKTSGKPDYDGETFRRSYLNWCKARGGGYDVPPDLQALSPE